MKIELNTLYIDYLWKWVSWRSVGSNYIL